MWPIQCRLRRCLWHIQRPGYCTWPLLDRRRHSHVSSSCSLGSGSFATSEFQLTLLFVPTSYGEVTPTAPEMELRQSPQDVRLASDEIPSHDATTTEDASTSALLEQTQQLLSQVKESQRVAADTTSFS